MRASTLWCLGYPDQARQRRHEALSLARELRHPYSVAQSLYFGARHYMICRDVQAAYEQAEAAVTLATEQGFTLWAILSVSCGAGRWPLRARLRQDWCRCARAWQTRRPQGQGSCSRCFMPCWPKSMGKWERSNEARCELTEAMAVSKQGQHFYKAEMYRLRATCCYSRPFRI